MGKLKGGGGGGGGERRGIEGRGMSFGDCIGEGT